MIKAAAAPILGVDAHATIADRTRRIYDLLSGVYPVSAYFFHSKAHEEAINMSGIRDSMRVLEVATGCGEVFRRIVSANPSGTTVGLDLSPRMAARTLKAVRHEFPDVSTQCKAVDARYMPFRDESFDAIVCCYLLELLASDDIVATLREIYRVLRSHGVFTLVLVGRNRRLFDRLYQFCGTLAPAFWGRQVGEQIPALFESLDFRIAGEKIVWQKFYASRVLTAQK